MTEYNPHTVRQRLICSTQGHFFGGGSTPTRGGFIAGNTAHQIADFSIIEEKTLFCRPNLCSFCCGWVWERGMRSTNTVGGVAFITSFPTVNHLPLPMRRVKYFKSPKTKQENQLIKLHLLAVRPKTGLQSGFSSCLCHLTEGQSTMQPFGWLGHWLHILRLWAISVGKGVSDRCPLRVVQGLSVMSLSTCLSQPWKRGGNKNYEA